MCWDSTWNKEIVEALLLEQKSIYIYIFISENTCKDLMCHCNIQCIFQTDAVSSRRTWYSMVVLSKCSIALMKMHLCLHTGGKWWEHARYWKYAGQTSGANIGPIFHFPKYHHIFLVVWRPVLWFTRFSGMNIRTSTGRHTWSDTGRCIDVINLKF